LEKWNTRSRHHKPAHDLSGLVMQAQVAQVNTLMTEGRSPTLDNTEQAVVAPAEIPMGKICRLARVRLD
jgi:hypothetical protein